MTPTNPSGNGFWASVLKQNGVLGVIVLVLVLFILGTLTKKLDRISDNMGGFGEALWSLCELEARDLPFEQRRQYCKPQRAQAAEPGYLDFFTGTIGGDGIAINP